jgi:ribonuclease P protein component
MLAHTFRFHGHGSLKYVFKQGETLRSKHLVLRITANSRRTHPRVAVVVSKKIYKAAVKRNRIRRRVFEIMRPLIADQTTSFDCAFIIVRPDILILKQEVLHEEIKSLFELGQETIHSAK